MRLLSFAAALWLVIFFLSISSVVYAATIGKAVCWNKLGTVIYEGKVKDMVYALDNPNMIWLKDLDNNDVFIQNLECLVYMQDGKAKQFKKDIKHAAH